MYNHVNRRNSASPVLASLHTRIKSGLPHQSAKSPLARFHLCVIGVFIGFFMMHPPAAQAESPCTVITTEQLPHNTRSFADAGDYDGDGVPDILMGGNPTQIISGRDRSVLLSIVVQTPGGDGILGPHGKQAKSIADINGDGVRDIIASATGGSRGWVEAFDGATGDSLYRLEGPTHSEYGIDIDIVGDVNGDGIEDFIVGQPLSVYGDPGPVPGRAFVYSGSDGAIIYSLTGPADSSLFGMGVAGVGDVDTDGTPDFAVGSRHSGALDGGQIRVYSGATATVMYVISSPVSNGSDFYPFDIASVGDINLDGTPDFIAGAPGDVSAGTTWAGRADILSGKDGSLIFTLLPDTSLFGPSRTLEYFGESVSGGNDVNTDGVPDIIVGAGLPAQDSRAYVFSGADQSLLTVLTGADKSSGVGRAVAMIGDVNGDCIGDIAISESLVMFQNTCARPTSCASGCCNIPGDANNDNSFNIADVSFSIARIFSGGPSPACQDEADANGDNMFNIADVTYDIARIFSGGPMPVCGSRGL